MKDVATATLLDGAIEVVIEYEGCGLYKVGVGRRCEASIECVGQFDTVHVVRRELESVFALGDAIEFSGIAFDSVDDAIRAVEIALGITSHG